MFHKIPPFFLCLLFFLCFAVKGIPQGGFSLDNNKKKDKISFELVNNLVIIPVEVNGTKLSFLLDTGVNNTLLFGVAEEDSVQIKNAQPVRIRGLGDGGATDALISKNNTLRIGKALDENHTLYVVLDKSLNFSTRMGIPVHGIVGYDFFKDFIVKTDYTSKRVTFYDPEYYRKRRCSSCLTFPFDLKENKPLIRLNLEYGTTNKEVVLLVDSGSSDALWLFREDGYISEDPKNYFESFLGLGLSGDIFGKRSRVPMVLLKDLELTDVTTSFPDPNALGNGLPEERDGSLGSEILRRFTVTVDYGSKTMQLKKNRYFDDPFHYDMSGLTLEHDGLIPVKDVASKQGNSMLMVGRNQNGNRNPQSNDGIKELIISPSFIFFLAPRLVVAEIREDSPAALAGVLKGDEIIRVNGKEAYKYKLYELVSLFSSKPGKKITLEINRNGYNSKIQFVLKKVI